MEEGTLSKTLNTWLDQFFSSLNELKDRLRAGRYGMACEPAGRDWVVWGLLTSELQSQDNQQRTGIDAWLPWKMEWRHFYFLLAPETWRKQLCITTSHSSSLKSFQKHDHWSAVMFGSNRGDHKQVASFT